MVKLLLKCEITFPFIHKAIQILQSILPGGDLTPEQELLFVLRAYGKMVTGQNLNIEKVIQNEDFSFDAFLDRGNSMAVRDKFSRKIVAISRFNDWLEENGYNIRVQPNPTYL